MWHHFCLRKGGKVSKAPWWTKNLIKNKQKKKIHDYQITILWMWLMTVIFDQITLILNSASAAQNWDSGTDKNPAQCKYICMETLLHMQMKCLCFNGKYIIYIYWLTYPSPLFYLLLLCCPTQVTVSSWPHLVLCISQKCRKKMLCPPTAASQSTNTVERLARAMEPGFLLWVCNNIQFPLTVDAKCQSKHEYMSSVLFFTVKFFNRFTRQRLMFWFSKNCYS